VLDVLHCIHKLAADGDDDKHDGNEPKGDEIPVGRGKGGREGLRGKGGKRTASKVRSCTRLRSCTTLCAAARARARACRQAAARVSALLFGWRRGGALRQVKRGGGCFRERAGAAERSACSVWRWRRGGGRRGSSGCNAHQQSSSAAAAAAAAVRAICCFGGGLSKR